MTIPLFPTDVIPYLAGLGKISSKRFAIANLLGRLPVSIVMTLIGSHNLELSPPVLIVVALFTLTMFVILYYLGKKAEQREGNEANLGN